MDRQVSRFDAASDDGTVHTVIEYRRVLKFQSVTGQAMQARGPSRFTLKDGSHKIAANTFQIVASGVIIRRVT